jgi:antitoxin component of MazEF toxin-antitoxin module
VGLGTISNRADQEEADLQARKATHFGGVVDTKLTKEKVALIPVRDPDLTLEQLLSGVTEENIHGEVDFGRPVGKEVW